MSERLITYNFSVADPDETAALGALDVHWVVPMPITIVHVSVAPLEDDAGATLDINDDGTGVITAVDASDADVPGTWSSTHFGGTNAPVEVAAGSELSLDFNSAAAANQFYVIITALTGE